MQIADGTVKIPERLRPGLTMAGLLPAIRSIVSPTMAMLSARYSGNVHAPGWIDMKFDPVDGKERDAALEFYRKDRVYGWIQGRGLESLEAHLRAAAAGGRGMPEAAELAAVGDSLYRKLADTCLPGSGSGIRAFFAMDPSGSPLGGDWGTGAVTLTHLFVLRGLLAWAGHRHRADDMKRIVPVLRRAVDESILGRCLDDQVKFGDRGGEDYSVDRKGYEGQMISIGACELLYANTGEAEDLGRGVRAIQSVLSSFAIRSGDGEPVLIDAIDAAGRPLKENGRLSANPGHAIEFAGLALQFLRRAGVIGDPALERDIGTLRSVAMRCDRIGRAPHGGILRSVDAESGEVLNGNCPWWSSFEAARTFAELSLLARDENEKAHCIGRVAGYVEVIRNVYLRPSSVGIPVQTVSFEGDVVPVIPATPDIDAGYHTGMPLLDVAEIAGEHGALLCGAAVERIPPRLGVLLQGHVARTLPADREMDPLHVRCCWLISAGTRVLVLSADILEFPGKWADEFTAATAAEYGIPEADIFLLATHTHTAPCAMKLGLLEGDAAFLASLRGAMRDAIAKAWSRLEPAALAHGESTVEGIGINRRFRNPATGKIGMKPNPRGENDEKLVGLFAFGADGALRTVLFNMAVHPTTLGVAIHEVSADYPGSAARLIGEKFGPGVVAIPIQGACGDIRPKVLDGEGNEFAEGTAADVLRIGSAVADAVVRAFTKAAGSPGGWILDGNLSVSTRTVELPFANLPTFDGIVRIAEKAEESIAVLEREEGAAEDRAGGFARSHDNPLLDAKTTLAWARGVGESCFDPNRRYKGELSVTARFGLCSIGSSFFLFSLPGEAFCHIGKTLRERAAPAALLVAGYCGGTVGYIPTASAFSEGGYEVEGAFRYYGYPAPLSPSAEAVIYSLFEAMRKEAEG